MHAAQPPRSRQRGFTLMELMVAVVIVGILAAIALPSYRSYVLRANRALVRAMLVDIAAKMEVEVLRTGAYPSNFNFYLADTAGSLMSEREFFIDSRGVVVGDAGDAGFEQTVYEIKLENPYTDTGALSSSFKLNVRAVNAQRDDAQCMTMSLSSTGLRKSTPAEPAECWGR